MWSFQLRVGGIVRQLYTYGNIYIGCRVYVLTPQHQTPFGVSPRPSIQLNPEDFDALKVPQNLIGPEDENTCIEDK